MKRVPVFLVIFLMLASIAYCEGPASRDVQRSASLGECATAQEVYEGNHLRAVEACEVWKASPQEVKILDVRTPEEYVYVGHAPAAINVPLSLWTGKWDLEKKDFALSENPHFVSQVKERFKSGDMILVMCRSVELSTQAVDRLKQEGFWNVVGNRCCQCFSACRCTRPLSSGPGISGSQISGKGCSSGTKAEKIFPYSCHCLSKTPL